MDLEAPPREGSALRAVYDACQLEYSVATDGGRDAEAFARAIVLNLSPAVRRVLDAVRTDGTFLGMDVATVPDRVVVTQAPAPVPGGPPSGGPPASMPAATCSHEEFFTRAAVTRESKAEGGPIKSYGAAVVIECTQCREPFRWLGLPVGVLNNGPSTSVDGVELRGPIAPGRALEAFREARYEFPEPEEPRS